MAVMPLVPGLGLAQLPLLVIDKFREGSYFGLEFDERKSSHDFAKSFTNYFGRVHQEYKDISTAKIENLVKRLLQATDPMLMNLVRDNTVLEDSFINRLFKGKTPLGDVLQELQNSLESPNRKLLSKELFIQAETEARKLIEKTEALITEKQGRKKPLVETPSSAPSGPTIAKKSRGFWEAIKDAFYAFKAAGDNIKSVI